MRLTRHLMTANGMDLERGAFLAGCQLAKVEPTARQQRRWCRREGAAWEAWTAADRRQREEVRAGLLAAAAADAPAMSKASAK